MTETTQAVLPSETGGYGTSRFNALRHGVLSRYTVLPWEDEGEYKPCLRRLSPSTDLRGQRKSTWSRNSSASCGASEGCEWLRQQLIGVG